MLLDREVPDDGQDNLRVPIHGVTSQTLPAALGMLGSVGAAYAQAVAFKGEEGKALLVPGENGQLACVLFGVRGKETRSSDPFIAGNLAGLLPEGAYRFAQGFDRPDLAALAFELASYRFNRFRSDKSALPRLETPEGVDGVRVALIVEAIAFGRDLINRPANDLGPDALEDAVREFAEQHGARVSTIRGAELVDAQLPMVHAVGRAAKEEPRLVEMRWGSETAPKVTLVGKGVCFDTGGLDIKPSSAMLLMKKDMGGAATALALAGMVMGAQIPVRLRVILPIVENAISADSFRPGDVLHSRKGFTVEIGNTDAEGRLILADALALADEETPDLLLDFATLTGAARVALGPDLPAFYTMSTDLAASIARHGDAVNDPGWRMPLWNPYDKMLKSKVADLTNVSAGSFAGSVTAALFLRRFVDKTANWAHFDIYGWTPTAQPGRPEGGEVQMARNLFSLISERYAFTGDPDA